MGKQQDSIDILKPRTIQEYSLLKGEEKELVDNLIKDGLKPNSVLRLNEIELKPKQDDLWLLEWGDLEVLRSLIREQKMFESIKFLYDVKDKGLLKLDVFNVFAVYKWITESISQIQADELEKLGYEPTAKEKNAGIEMFEEFEYYNSLHALTNGLPHLEDSVMKIPYQSIFRNLCMRARTRDYKENYSKLK